MVTAPDESTASASTRLLGELLLATARSLGADSSHMVIHDAGRDRLVSVALTADGVIVDHPLDFPREIPARASGAFRVLHDRHEPRTFNPGTEPDLFWPGTLAYHRELGSRCVQCIPLHFGGRFVGFMGLAFRQPAVPLSARSEVAQLLAQQAAMAVEIKRLADAEHEAVLQRDRARAAQSRAAMLERANIAMQKTVDVFGRLGTLADAVPSVLKIIAEAFGAACGAYFEHQDRTMFLRHWCKGGQLFGPADLPELKDHHAGVLRRLTGGFTVAVGHFGGDPFIRNAPVVIDHRLLGGDEELQRFCLSLGWDFELNIPLVVGDRTVGTLVVYRRAPEHFTEDELSFSAALGKQLALAIQVTRRAEQERETALARERAIELAKANQALRMTLDRLADTDSPDEILGQVLRVAATQAGVELAHLWEHDDQGWVRLRLGYCLGEVFGPADFSRMPLWPVYLAPFQGLPAITGGERANERTRHFVRDLFDGDGTRPPAGDHVSQVYRSLGVRREINVPLRFNGRCGASLSVYLAPDREACQELIELIHALGHQATLALELIRQAEAARESAELRIREQAALARSREFEHTTEALQRTVDAVSELESLEDFVPRALHIMAEAFGASSAGYFEHGEALIFLRFWLVNGVVHGPSALPGLSTGRYALMAEMSAGFTVPHEHLGTDPFRRTAPSILHHRTATASPRLHQFATSMGWDWELNVPLMVGGRLDGAITLFRSDAVPFTEADFPLAQALAKQVALGVKISRLADRDREAAIALHRADELAKANAALRMSLDNLAEARQPDEFLGQLLRAAAAQTEVELAHLWVVDEEGWVRLRMGYCQGRVFGPDQSADMPLARLYERPFRVPPAMIGEEPVEQRTRHFVQDVLASAPMRELVDEETLAAFASLGVRQEINVPLRFKGRCVAALAVYLPAERKARQELIELVYALGHQATLAMELTRFAEDSRRAETARAVAAERERAAALQVRELWAAQSCLRDSGRKLQSLEALDDYLLDIVRAASGLMNAEGGAFGLLDAGHTALMVKDTFPDADADHGFVSRSFSIDLSRQPHPLWKHIALSNEYWWADIDDCRFAQTFRDYHGPKGRTHFAHFPVRVNGAPAGFLGFAFQPGRSPSSTAIEVVNILAEHAALAVQVSRLADQARSAAVARERELAASARTRDLIQANEALKRGIARLSEDVNVGDFLGQVLSEAARQIGARTNSILLHDEALDTLTLLRHHVAGATGTCVTDMAAAPEPVAAKAIPLWEKLRRGWVLTHDPDDVRSCERLQPPSGRAGHLTVLAVPLSVGGRLIGFMAPAFAEWVDVSAEHVELVQALAHQATLALELTRMSDAARNAAALRATADERERIAGEIHDSLAQNFSSIAIQSEMLAKTSPVNDAVRSTLGIIARTARLGLAEARATVLAMSTMEGSPGSLEQALEQLAERCTIQGVVQVSLVRSGPPSPIGADAANVALRVAQEAVTNALRHAGGSRIQIALDVTAYATRLEVRDDGVGIDPVAARRKGGFGLSSMQARASSLGARLSIDTLATGGTQVGLEVRHDPRSTATMEDSTHE